MRSASVALNNLREPVLSERQRVAVGWKAIEGREAVDRGPCSDDDNQPIYILTATSAQSSTVPTV